MPLNLEQREIQLYLWLKNQLQLDSDGFNVISGDASFRRYFRLQHSSGTVIGVDAPPTDENNAAFIAIARGLLKSGLRVPEVLAVDLENGFLALSDLGDQLLLPELNNKTVDGWYQTAMQQLLLIQQTTNFTDYPLPLYDQKLFMQEMQLMPDWFLSQHLNLHLKPSEREQLQTLFLTLSKLALSQPQVTVHRDFHSRNLMITKDKQLGIIDFQDAVIGPINYDLISLIKDCYIRWPQSMVEQWIKDFYYLLESSGTPGLPAVEEFIFLADAMAMQRHIKVVGIFCRLNYRDGKPGYLPDLRLTLDYIVEAAARHQQFNWFSNWLNDKVLPAFNHRQKQLGL